ncbi:MAG: heavy-metal-associated domain-containing protein [bacterium]
MQKLRYMVPGMVCDHCLLAVSTAVRQVPGVNDVDIDFDTKMVVVTGWNLDDEAVRAAISEAGYEVKR